MASKPINRKLLLVVKDVEKEVSWDAKRLVQISELLNDSIKDLQSLPLQEVTKRVDKVSELTSELRRLAKDLDAKTENWKDDL